MNALIIDDEKEICLLLSHQLRKMGLACHTANNLYQGLTLFKGHDFDYVFLDINLPDGNGLELVPALRTTKQSDDLVITIISAYDTRKERERAANLGVNEFLRKPFSKEMINRVVYKQVQPSEI